MDNVQKSNLYTWIKVIISVFAISENALKCVEYTYTFDIPVLKQLSIMLSEINAEGLSSLLVGLGVGFIYFYVKSYTLQKDRGISILSVFFAVSTVIGKSYYELGNWNYIFHGRIQFVLALLVATGYYFLYKQCILLIHKLIEKNQDILRCETKGKVEAFLFEKYPFACAALFFTVCFLPYYIAFFPGTIHADATTQLYEYFGMLELSGHHPVFITKLMGICVEIGKILFNSDNIGVSLYITVQIVFQILIFSYTVWLLCRMQVPLLFRWAALILYGILPLFPMNAITLVKDTAYYEAVLLFVASLIHLCWKEEKKPWWNSCLLLLSAVGICVSRKEGKYLAVAVLVLILCIYRKKWKICLISICACMAASFMIEGVYMPANGVEKGNVAEMLSIPLQQTARYFKEYGMELSSDEKQQLQQFFTLDLETIADYYDAELSDPVKNNTCLSGEDGSLTAYFKVWFDGLKKHPDTYVQAYLNQTYGYFYPDRGCRDHGSFYFRMLGRQQWNTPFMSIHFGIQDSNLRSVMEAYTGLLERLPVIKLSYSPGAYVYGLLGCAVYLLRKKKKKELSMLFPSFLILVVCMISPVNANLRYSLPLIALMPVNLAWCYKSCSEKHEKETVA